MIKPASVVAICFFCLLVSACPALRGETFTIAVLPDPQNYVSYYAVQPASTNIYNSEAQFIVNNRAAMNIVFVSHLGDAWNNSSLSSEMPRSQSAVDILKNADIPMGIVPGNHDYDYGTGNGYIDNIHGSALWNTYFGPAYFSGKSWYGGAYINSTDTTGMTSWQTFHAGSWNFLHIALEIEPSDDVLSWVQNVIDAHPGWPTIVTIHEWIEGITGGYLGAYITGYPGSELRVGYPHNSDQQVWDEFIKVNPQIFTVLCGHFFYNQIYGSYCRINENNAGYDVYQMLSDYQDAPSSSPSTLGTGGGWVRLIEFDTSLKTMHVRTYSTVLGKYSNDPSLTEGSTYARYWAKFNYQNGTGSLLPSDDVRSSDFVLPMSLGVIPIDCNDAISKGYELSYDFNHDCRVNFEDFAWIDFDELASFVTSWLYCVDPTIETCLRPWE